MAGEVAHLAEEMNGELRRAFDTLRRVGARMAEETRGQRLVDLALNAIEIVDRNLYERTCDVRWWATDIAVVEAAAEPTPERLAHAARRLGVILSAYTVYLDLWLCDAGGRVLAGGRPDRFPAQGLDVSGEAWFRAALACGSGDDFAVADVAPVARLGGAPAATYAAAVREGGGVRGRPIGVLGIHFDWQPQAEAVVRGVRLSPAERAHSRVMLLGRDGCVLACSRGQGVFSEVVRVGDAPSGTRRDERGRVVAWHRTPGYETYKGLGWSGAILQEPPRG